MAREWDTKCLVCGEDFSFSHTTYRKLLRQGQVLPQACSTCAAEFMRERRSIGRLEALIRPVIAHKGLTVAVKDQLLATQPVGEIRQMLQRSAVMTDAHVSVGRLASAYRVDEISEVPFIGENAVLLRDDFPALAAEFLGAALQHLPSAAVPAQVHHAFRAIQLDT